MPDTLNAVLLVRGDDADRTAATAHAVSAWLAGSDRVTRAVLSVADVDPGDAAWVRPGEAPALPRYQAVIELTAQAGGFSGIVAQALAALTGTGVTCDGYRVTRTIERDEPPRAYRPARSPGTRYLVLCNFHPDLPDTAARRSWDHHVPLALRVHAGAARYVRSWVDAVLTPGSPPFQGMTELYFPTDRDMRERWFPTPDLRAQIVQDIGHFLHSGVRLYTSEYIYKHRGDA